MTSLIPYPAQLTRLDNGLTVILVPMPANGLLAYWTIVRTGSRDEYEANRTGFAHFFEHMMFRGTEKYPSEAYHDILTRIGADANAFTTDDLTAYHISFAAEDLEQVMQLESDRFANLDYSEQDFRTEAGAVYGEYRKTRTDPLFALHEAMAAATFDVHPYGHTTMGYEEDIIAMPSLYPYSREFFARYYRPDNTVLFLAGDLEAEPTMRLVRRYYDGWQSGYVEPPIPAEPEQREARRVDVGYDGRTLPLVWVAYKVDRFDPGNRLRVAADLLAELAFGETSDIYRKLVLETQSVEFLAADAGMNRDPGLFDIYARVKDPGRIDDVIEAIDTTVDAYRHRPAIDAGRLAALKSRLRYEFLMNLETPDEVAEHLARPIAISGSLDGIEALYAAYEDVTAEDVEGASEAYLQPARRTIGVLRGRG